MNEAAWQAALEQAWAVLAARLAPSSVQWSCELTLFLPTQWPLRSGAALVSHVYAQGFDFSGGLADAVRVAAPWARMVRPAARGAAPRLVLFGDTLAPIGVQGVRPLSAAELAAAGLSRPVVELLLEAGRPGPEAAAAAAEVRAFYGDWARRNGVIAQHVRAQHPAFFDWL